MEKLNENMAMANSSEVNLNNTIDGIYYDLPLLTGVRGTIMYRKLSNQDVLEIYARGGYRGTLGAPIIGILPEGFRPYSANAGSNISGQAECNGVWEQTDLIIHSDGTMEIPALSNDQIRGFSFFGVMRL